MSNSLSYTYSDYDGSLIHSRFGYKLFRKEYNPLGVIHISRGNMDVKDNLIDLEDKLSNDFIYSDDALSICWEIPNMNPLGAVFFQRLFVQEIANLFRKDTFGLYDVSVEGDDLMLRKRGMGEDNKETWGKASVSITKVTDTIALGHIGINIDAGPKAPSFAFSLFLDDDQTTMLAYSIYDIFYEILQDCFCATTKVI
jgi:hypothetical protein